MNALDCHIMCVLPMTLRILALHNYKNNTIMKIIFRVGKGIPVNFYKIALTNNCILESFMENHGKHAFSN